MLLDLFPFVPAVPPVTTPPAAIVLTGTALLQLEAAGSAQLELQAAGAAQLELLVLAEVTLKETQQ